ncbi:hypothetical protein [Fischerella sp. PCC 9605]|uniref:hypothetical protein n=1 Tax=Fischerella sp. PCC 9605 TaxID=1173024 RepID=UPI00047DF0B3|nr:hypothetical protein [Fischerella sp. PCC 9605]
MIKVSPKIVIGGVPRTGKSNLAYKLFDYYHGSIIHGDTLVNAIKNNYKNAFDTNFDNIDKNNYVQQLLPIQKYLIKIIRNMGKDLEYNVQIFESCYILPESILRLNGSGQVCGVFLLYNQLNFEQKIQDIRNYALTNQHCWSHKYTDSQLRQTLKEFIALSQFFRQECSKHNIKWFDIDDQWNKKWTSAYDFIVNQVTVSPVG